jgi:hypothetical protein
VETRERKRIGERGEGENERKEIQIELLDVQSFLLFLPISFPHLPHFFSSI